ncbi:MAG: OmpA family protein [Bacteroidota bacterium]
MFRLFFSLMIASLFAITTLQAQSEGAPDAFSVRYVATNFLWPLENVDDFSADDFRGGLEFEYIRYLNETFDVSFPFRMVGGWHPSNSFGIGNRESVDMGLNALLNVNFYKGKVFRPRLFAGVGGLLLDVDELSLDVPLGLGLNWYLGRNTSLSTTFSYHINDMEFRDHLMAGIGFRLSMDDYEEPEPVILDRDGDGILDTEDLCPDTPGIPALNGCPDQDGDGITDANDKCPTVAGIAAFEGCPDTDGDGLQDSEDECPEEAGPADNNGCPIRDRDGDGVVDDADNCPDEVGTVANNGCPEKSLVVTARDKITNEVMPGVDVAIVNSSGQVVKSGTTNSLGIVEIPNLEPGNYTVTAKVVDTDLEGATIQASDFNSSEPVQKTVYFDDPNFIIQGKVLFCNTPNPLPGVTLNLKSTTENMQKATVSNAEGEYLFFMDQRGTYELYATKESFLSQVVEVNAGEYDRSKSVFVKIEVCAEEVECGEAIRLNNILYDTGSAVIRSDAEADLNKVVQFLRDNKDATIELSSHTDSRGGADSNMRLSQRRAQAAADYIVAQGIASSRVVGTGYGETRLVNNCADGVRCSAEEHQENRRTEFKVICPD